MREKGVLRMDTIQIKGLRIFAYHGVGPEEKRDGQPFVLDIAMKADLSRARRSDDLEDTVNYAAVVEAVRDTVVRMQNGNGIKAEDISPIVDELIPQQLLVSAYRKYNK